MKMINLYKIAETNNTRITECMLPVNDSLCAEIDNKYYIGLHKNLNDKEKYICLAHELGHCLYGGFYNRYSPYDIIEKAEHRANVWAIKKLLPLAKLKNELQKGITSYEIAEEIGVTEDFINLAYNYYKNNLGVNFQTI